MSANPMVRGNGPATIRCAFVIVFLTLGGCATPPDPFSGPALASAYADADARINGTSDASHEFTLKISVPISANHLLVKATYRSVQEGSFVLKRPDGNGARFDTFLQPRQVEDVVWFETREPPHGRWLLNGHLTRGGAYAFGVYVD